ncbi:MULTISPECIES: sugar ABC transporter substrate-binding protein [unclassified Nonomuraea]|uniref:sugar ABC transporter substrate-binding protein n=1 Tax=unclassified Nonomuraea TaxID=2593643 RepID=UPI0033CB14B9
MIRRNLAAATAVTATLALALSGCGRSNDRPRSDAPASRLTNGPATGTITVWAQGTEGEALAGFLKPFKDKNPGVDVKVTAIPWDSAQNKYQTAIAGGTTPDIGMLGSDWMPTFASALRPAPADIDTGDIFPVSLQTTDIGGARLGVPWYVETRVLFYRTDLMKKAGFDSFPKDWQGFKALATAYQDKTGAKYGVTLPSGGWNAFLNNLPFVWSNGADLMNADQTKWTFDTPRTVEALDYLSGFFKEGIANKNPDAETGSTASAFVNGSVPMFISGPWDIPGLKTAGGAGFEDKFAVAPIPAPPGGTSTSFAAGANLAVFKNSKNPDAAWKLVQWLTQPDVQVEWFKTVNDLPSRQSAWKDPALTADPKVAVFGEQLKSTKTAPVLTTWTQVSAAADTEIERVFRGGKSPQDAVRQLQSTADSLGTGK